MSLAMMHVTIAQNSPTDFLNAHNTARAQDGVGAMRASTCSLVLSNGPYGENLAWSASSTFTGIAAVNVWVADKQFYTYSTNTCATGKVCKHYTQVVWQNSVRLGCARVVCNNNAGVFIICSYDVPGNIDGQSPY
ncbi:hypothetical protein AQUCO_13300027v1 [Aquilegia coerulea]|uniref:SCP domain-containing protein n=1 Tax=Aquilegia coerulea TaxID=218851 RepID=A0A2G5C177_AQUCA|nr:hypothetical protein AQUCO_13300027v1 [Aquilegia coerulea]